jgi:hypothetical protein
MGRVAHAVHTGWRPHLPHLELPSARGFLLAALVVMMALVGLWALSLSVHHSATTVLSVPARVVPASPSAAPAPERATPAVETARPAMIITVDEPIVITGRVHKRPAPAQ